MNNNTEDIKLVEDFLEGSEKAFNELLGKYLKAIYNFLRKFVKDGDALDDLTQETFIKVWKNLHHFDQSRNFRVWIFSIAKNTAFDYLKKKKSLPFSFFENDQGYNKLEETSSNSPFPEEFLEREEAVRELEQELKKIPEIYQIILTLKYKNDFTLQEISEILGKPYNTIKSQHQRAIGSLKKAFLDQ